MLWLLESGARLTLAHAYDKGRIPTADECERYEAASNVEQLQVFDGVARIGVRGVLTKKRDWFAEFFGGGNTVYGTIITALAQAQADPNVKNITLDIDSPGGQFDGLFDVINAMQNTTKPITARVSGLGASAAYAIASQADTIVATNKAVRVGSVGVAVSMFVSDQEVSIASTDAPKKRPDVTTKEGVAMVREELDALHEIFVDAIATGRGITTKKVNSDFGEGATLLAETALERGMIDSIESAENKTSRKAGNNKMGAMQMDLQELKAQHPSVYLAAVAEGVAQERDRVNAHLTMGEASGDTKTASAAIKDGSEMTATLQAKYLAAGMNKSNVDARQSDDVSASGADGAAAPTQADAGATVADLVESQLGLKE